MIRPGPHFFDSEDDYLDALEAAQGRPLTYDEWEEGRSRFSRAKYEQLKSPTCSPTQKFTGT